MNTKRMWVIVCLLAVAFAVTGQKKWRGGDTGNWENEFNWEPAGVPDSTDEVLLDNSIQQSGYVVKLPLTTISVHVLRITPAPGKAISVVLPKENVRSPALVLHDAGDALVIDSGAVFLNSSGLTSGSSIRCVGSIRINNGGKYIHNTRSIHANDIAGRLSVAPGTEEGEFEFDVPAASTTISLSNRVFGKLKLSSSANGGTVSYNGSGVNPLVIRSDLEIGAGVQFSISFSNRVTIQRHLLQRGGTFNIANAGAATWVAVGGDVIQESGIITKSGAAVPSFLLNGTHIQQVDFRGSFAGDIIFKLDNPTEVILLAPLALSYRFELLSGILRTSNANLLTLLPRCTVAADSTGKSFVDGPLRKEGLAGVSHFLFPVGKQANLRWIELKSATGNFTVEYEKENPSLLSTALSEELHHISSVERWSIVADPTPAPMAKVELSFDHVNSGGVTDLETLKVAQLSEGAQWTNAGHTGYTGTAGAAGSVVSKPVTAFDSSYRYFTLASSVSGQNTLPLKRIAFGLKRRGDVLLFNFTLSEDIQADYFILEGSVHGIVFAGLRRFSAAGMNGHYLVMLDSASINRYFRLTVVEKDGSSFYSEVLFDETPVGTKITLQPSLVRSKGRVLIQSGNNEQVQVEISDAKGRVWSKNSYQIKKGETQIQIDVQNLPAGVYFFRAIFRNEIRTIRFLKL